MPVEQVVMEAICIIIIGKCCGHRSNLVISEIDMLKRR